MAAGEKGYIMVDTGKKTAGSRAGQRRIVALVQARLGSARLPGKMLLPLHGVPLIDWVLRRVARAELLDAVVLATSTKPRDNALAGHVESLGFPVFRGPENDVLERFRQAGLWAGASHVVRVCADNPLIWGGEIDNLIRHYFSLAGEVDHIAGNAGTASHDIAERAAHENTSEPAPNPCAPDALPDKLYVYNHIPRNNLYPDGLGAEMISYALLEELAARAVIPAHREHCFSFIWDNPQLFSIQTFDPADPFLRRPDIRLDIDTGEDYQRMARLPVEPASAPQDVIRAYDAVFGGPGA
jgi:spore coat polysaccharide biosynthesis protein SpsF